MPLQLTTDSDGSIQITYLFVTIWEGIEWSHLLLGWKSLYKAVNIRKQMVHYKKKLYWRKHHSSSLVPRPSHPSVYRFQY